MVCAPGYCSILTTVWPVFLRQNKALSVVSRRFGLEAGTRVGEAGFLAGQRQAREEAEVLSIVEQVGIVEGGRGDGASCLRVTLLTWLCVYPVPQQALTALQNVTAGGGSTSGNELQTLLESQALDFDAAGIGDGLDDGDAVAAQLSARSRNSKRTNASASSRRTRMRGRGDSRSRGRGRGRGRGSGSGTDSARKGTPASSVVGARVGSAAHSVHSAHTAVSSSSRFTAVSRAIARPVVPHDIELEAARARATLTKEEVMPRDRINQVRVVWERWSSLGVFYTVAAANSCCKI